MKKSDYSRMEEYMLSCMCDSAHDSEHVYRVLYNALEIAKSFGEVDYDILITACLLHDIGRKEQFEDPKLDHAEVGGEKAYRFLTENGFGEKLAAEVRSCIVAHRFRKSNPPRSLEAKILFDADKIDVTGAMGVARTLVYKGNVGDALYSLKPDGSVSDGSGDDSPSFFQEYKFKLENLYDRFYTERGKQIAASRRSAAVDFYNSLFAEVNAAYLGGRESLGKILK